MKTIAVQLDHRMRVLFDDIPSDLREPLLEALEIPNMEREKAKENHVQGWQKMPETIVLWDTSKDDQGREVLDMPRGFLHQFERTMMEDFEISLWITDKRAEPKVFPIGKKIVPRDHQPAAIEDIIDIQQGIYKAPPGSGKTVTVLAAGKKASTRCLIVVNTKDILNQWVTRIGDHLGPVAKVGIVGGRKKATIGNFWTVATAQTLHSRFDKLEEEGFFDHFGFVCLDESHHATAVTYRRVMDRFSARTRIGVSATPDKTGDFELATNVLGPIIHTTTHEGLVKAGYLIEPEIVRIKTEFTFSFQGTTSRWQRTNYPDLLKALIDDPRRNDLIIRAIWKYGLDHHSIVLTKRHDHIDLIEALLQESGWELPTWRLTGKEKDVERERVIEEVGKRPGVLFSTIADEALDVPRVDRGFLIWPQKNIGLIQQQVGRFERAHPDKKDSIVVDFADSECGPLRKQWQSRYMKVYKDRGFKIHMKKEKDFV